MSNNAYMLTYMSNNAYMLTYMSNNAYMHHNTYISHNTYMSVLTNFSGDAGTANPRFFPTKPFCKTRLRPELRHAWFPERENLPKNTSKIT